MAKYTDDGRREIPDPVPVSLPLGFREPEPLADLIRRLVRNEVSQAASREGEETFEEADDFDVSDDDEAPLSVYQELPLALEEMPESQLPDKDAGTHQNRSGRPEKPTEVSTQPETPKSAPAA